MTDKQIVKYAKGFSSGVIGKDLPNKKCFMVCSPLVTLLNGCGVNCVLKDGYIAVHEKDATKYWNHYWIELADGRILDPTASQFTMPDGTVMPFVYLGQKPSWYMKSKSKKTPNHERK